MLRKPKMADSQIDDFHSPTSGVLSFMQVINHALDFMAKEDNSRYKLVIGTDSEINGSGLVHFVSAIVVHHVGHGGVYFWRQITKNGIKDLRQRMYEEATYSLSLAQRLFEELKQRDLPGDKLLEIHVDVGRTGDTRTMINEIVGMVRGSGFVCKTKPEAFAASNVADRHT